MTPKQRAFVEAYAGNATEAAIKAGYSKKTARQIGQRLLTKADIIEAIKKRQEKELRPHIATRQERQKFWSDAMNNAKLDMRDRLRASELLGKSEADFTENVNNNHAGSFEVDLKSAVRGALLERRHERVD